MRFYPAVFNYYTLIIQLLYSSTPNQSIVVIYTTIGWFSDYYRLVEGITILWLRFSYKVSFLV